MKHVTVYGTQKPMGSKRAFKTKSGKLIVTDQSGEKLKSWQHDIRVMMLEKPGQYEGPISIEIYFHIPRPKSHYGTGKNANVLKADVPEYVTVKPDLDKLARAVLDCGTGIWYRDDSQVCEIKLVKQYTDGPAYTVIVMEAA